MLLPNVIHGSLLSTATAKRNPTGAGPFFGIGARNDVSPKTPHEYFFSRCAIAIAIVVCGALVAGHLSARCHWRACRLQALRDPRRIVRRWSPGIFRLVAIGELVGYKPCARLRGGLLSSLGGFVIRIRILMYRDVSCVYPEGYMYPSCILMYLKCILNALVHSKRIHVS